MLDFCTSVFCRPYFILFWNFSIFYKSVAIILMCTRQQELNLSMHKTNLLISLHMPVRHVECPIRLEMTDTIQCCKLKYRLLQDQVEWSELLISPSVVLVSKYIPILVGNCTSFNMLAMKLTTETSWHDVMLQAIVETTHTKTNLHITLCYDIIVLDQRIIVKAKRKGPKGKMHLTFENAPKTKEHRTWNIAEILHQLKRSFSFTFNTKYEHISVSYEKG